MNGQGKQTNVYKHSKQKDEDNFVFKKNLIYSVFVTSEIYEYQIRIRIMPSLNKLHILLSSRNDLLIINTASYIFHALERKKNLLEF